MQGRRMISGGFCILHKIPISFLCILIFRFSAARCVLCMQARDDNGRRGRGLGQSLRLMLRRL